MRGYGEQKNDVVASEGEMPKSHVKRNRHRLRGRENHHVNLLQHLKVPSGHYYLSRSPTDSRESIGPRPIDSQESTGIPTQVIMTTGYRNHSVSPQTF